MKAKVKASLKKLLDEAVERRSELQENFNDAMELGDAPENFPLDVARRKLLENEERISNLESTLALIQLSLSEVLVYLVKDDKGQESRFLISSTPLSVPGVKTLLPDSPLGACLVNAKVNNYYEYLTPKQARRRVFLIGTERLSE